MFEEKTYLQRLIENETPVTIFIMNGFVMKGVITGDDEYAIRFQDETNGEMMVYKQAISTIREKY